MKRAQIVFLLLLVACASITAQQLTVRDIMAEPSPAGMRAEGEKMSPDGSKVIFLWNAEGKYPRDLYLVPTSGGQPQIILKTTDMPVTNRRPQRENKLDYGLVLRDDFAKSREGQLGNFEWSPDSEKLLFSYAGDIYVLDLNKDYKADKKTAKWKLLEEAIRQRSILVKGLTDAYAQAMVDTELMPWFKVQQKNLEVSMQAGGKWDSQRQIVIEINQRIGKGLTRLFDSGIPESLANDSYRKFFEELRRAQNRVDVVQAEYEAQAKDDNPRRYTRTQSAEGGARFLDNDRILFSQSGNIFVWNITDSMLTQISREANPQAFIGVFGSSPNKAGTMIAYTVSDSSKQRALVVPNYLDEFVAAGNTRRGWSEQKVMVMPADGSRETAFEIKLPKSEGVGNFRRIIWAADDRSLIIDRNDKDTKRRQLFYVHNVGSKDEQVILIADETDPKWQAPLSNIIEADPKDPSRLFFASEKDGFNHLYLATLEKAAAQPNPTAEKRQENPTDPGYSTNVKVEQLTKGNWQIEWAKWFGDSGDIIFNSTESGTATRDFWVMNAAPGGTKWMVRTDGLAPGMKSGPQLESKGSDVFLLYEYSQWNRPADQYFQRLCYNCGDSRNSAKPIQITSTVPAAFSSIKFSEPKFIDFPARDGKRIAAKIYLPAGFNARGKQKYPMVIFVHGAGYLQNIINGWNNYYREFMFNDLLTRKGYVVLDIDYRGSAGYGREWRTDVYDFLGGPDYDDHIDGIDFMVKNYAVNQAKIGVYGGSYGGFMAEMLAMRAPDKIAAAAALRPVADWKNYYASSPGYTAQRLGFPDKNPEAYKRSSPISYADKLQRPLLILHGIGDDNVHVQDSMQLVEKLIRLGKTQYFETMFYPSENHGFVRPESWTDEYERILAFFEKHLK
ncbi:MAG: alpha/beta fold hydrolase [Acidobacteriota bacterium]